MTNITMYKVVEELGKQDKYETIVEIHIFLNSKFYL